MLVLANSKGPINTWLTPVAERPHVFSATLVGRDGSIELVPFYRLHRRTYSIYWDLE
jgi:hypothetical protein